MNTTFIDQMRADHSRLLDDSLKKIIQPLCVMPSVEKVILFGSFAAGRRDLFSDLDLIVTMQSEKAYIDRIADIYTLLRPSVDMDILVYTPEEFERMSQWGFIRLAVENGQVLYEK